MRTALAIVAASLLIAAGVGASLALAGNPYGQDPCSHGATGKQCKPDPGPGKDCDHHGNYGGQNEDHCTPPSTNPPPTTTTPPPTTPPPPGHDCVYTGAGKDGQPGNDDCAPITTPPATVPPTAPPVTQTVTVTVPSPPTVITKTVVKYKTRTVVKYKTRYKTKIVRKTIVLRKTCGCPVGTRLYHGKCHPIVPAKG